MIIVRPEDLPSEGGPHGKNRRQASGRSGTLAWIAFGLGAGSILFAGVALGPVAVIVGIVAAVQAERREGVGRHALVACGGVLCGIAGIAVWTVLILHWLDRARPPGPASGTAPIRITSGNLDREAIAQAPAPIRRALVSSASIRVLRRSGSEWIAESSGSGTFVGRADGRWFVLTCAHVVAGAKGTSADRRLRIDWLGGAMGDPRVEWVGPEWLDLAFVSTGASDGPDGPSTASVIAEPSLGVGDQVFAIGDPHQYRATYVRGVLSAVRIVTEGPVPLRIIQAQVPLNPGNSGGGLYDSAGRLIGVNSWKLAGIAAEGMGFSIAIDNLWDGVAGAPEAVARVVERMRADAAGAPPDDAAGSPVGR